MGTTTTNKRQRADWSLRPRGVVSTVGQAALGLTAASAVGSVAHLGPWWAAAGAAVGALGNVVVAAHRNHSGGAVLYRLACWAGAGGWLTWTLTTGPWHADALAALGVGAIGAGVLAPIANHTRGGAGRGGGALVLRAGGRIGAEWEARIARVCRVRVTVTQVVPWPTGAGYDVHAELPPGGATRAQIAQHANGLAADAKLPEGCGVEVAAGPHRGAIVLRVSAVSRLAEEIGYPVDYSPRSVLEPVVFGEHANGDPAQAVLREDAVLISGPRGSGKTTLLQVITTGLGRCADHLVWHLDLNGGGVTQPWIDVWLDERVERPPIDWAAAGLTEGKRMLRAGIAVAKHRKASYRRLKRERNSSLLPVSPSLPQISIIVDEGAQAVKDPELNALLTELQNIGRNEAVNLIICSLRPTSDLVPVNMRKQAMVRIQMFGPDQEELGHMFGWKRGISMDDLAGVGTGFLSVHGATPRPFRAYQILPAQIEEAAIAIARIRPDLDEASAQAAGEAYASRYERMRQVFGGDSVDLDEAPAAPASIQPPRLKVLPGGATTAASWGDPREIARTQALPANAAAWPDPHPHMRAVTTASATAGEIQAPSTPALPARPVPEILTRALAAMDAAHDDRMHSATLAAALGITQADLAGLLRPLGVQPLPHPFQRGGRPARGYAREDLEAAAERIRRGVLEVPPEVAAWPAA